MTIYQITVTFDVEAENETDALVAVQTSLAAEADIHGTWSPLADYIVREVS